MKEFMLAHRGGYWHLQPSRIIHAGKFIELDHALDYLTCRIRTSETALVTITDAAAIASAARPPALARVDEGAR